MRTIRVLVIDDSAFMRKMISEILSQDEQLEVIATARNGQDGLEKINKLSPDVVTLDVEMPVMDGFEALQQIMKEYPLPVVMVSSLTKSGADSTLKALQYGAIDFITKPSGSISLDMYKTEQEMIMKVKQAAKVDIRQIDNKTNLSLPIAMKPQRSQHKSKKIVVIGVSTGGPRALQKLLPILPKDFPAPILVVQHMPGGFTKSLAERLDRESSLTVKEATNGEFLSKGNIYIAPGDYHLEVRKIGISLTAFINQTEPIGGHRPSVNKLFESVADLGNYQKYALVLTGMGSDGSIGIKTLKEKDPDTTIVVESKESAVIFGMPKAAIETNQVSHVVRIEEMGSLLSELIQNE
ncbi:two-component system, chemotaxis family, response regulator CheB [Salinibacillus kushneri]|uniref:Protein-glutamate methylesterase/protein-glutamine glutaminase n=1 Tax=Salinibacillus kushneri TaxID=237682 RepID=A0A1I0E9N2_9BACI|nr:chemotaxis response regulator protein-glutamate methylesterase [Salinibacillus kushneri]SET41129.1 two-component system, chemotaxis family, response regulator CheB [Salinibacillus kushneri]